MLCSPFKWRRGVLLPSSNGGRGYCSPKGPTGKTVQLPPGSAGTERENRAQMPTGDTAAGHNIPKGSTKGSRSGREGNWVAATSHLL